MTPTSRIDCREIKILIYRLKEDSPKASTGVKLLKTGKALRLLNPRNTPKTTILLDPYAEKLLSIEDWRYKPRYILAVDRSWNKLAEDHRIGNFPRHVLRRRLPLFIASNPINYAKAYKLSTVEALAAALYLLDCRKQAENLLLSFKWGSQFYLLNKKILEEYSKHQSQNELDKIEEEVIKKILGNEK